VVVEFAAVAPTVEAVPVAFGVSAFCGAVVDLVVGGGVGFAACFLVSSTI